MRPISRGRWAAGLAFALALLLTAHAAGQAVDKAAGNSEKIRFDAVDGVELQGAFYPSARGNKAPCALLLHELGGSSQQEGWSDLAAELQKKGFAVLAFDFRGHGNSTDVTTSFYQDPINKTLKGARSVKTKDKVTIKDYTNLQQLLTLVNDIAAAKRFLDRKNDSSECNSSDLVVIGAGSGATLGALWVKTEWERRETPRNPFGIPIGPPGEPEGKNVAATVWLSISPFVGGNNVSSYVPGWMHDPIKDKVPMYFLYGEQDATAGKFAKYLDQRVKLTTDKSLKLTGIKAIPGSNKLAGRELLGKKSLATEELIIKYLEQVMDSRGSNVWVKREVDKTLPVRVPVERFLR